MGEAEEGGGDLGAVEEVEGFSKISQEGDGRREKGEGLWEGKERVS